MRKDFTSDRSKQIEVSPTMLLDAKAKAMIANGEDVINFSVGELDFPVPDLVKEEIKKALDENFTKYTPAGGIPELKEAICNKLRYENKMNYGLENIVVTTGAKQALYNAMLATLNEGDEVLIPSPYWVSFPEIVKLAGGVPKMFHNLELNYYFIHLISPKTKMLILNSPNNPSGEVNGKETLENIAKIAVEKNILVISDEIYEKMVYGVSHVSIASLNDDIMNLTITINGLSKSCSMTGLRLGYAAANKEIIAAMTKIQTQSTSSPTSIIQKGAVKALTMDQSFLKERVRMLWIRKDEILQSLDYMDGIDCPDPDGAFYVFPDVSELYNEKVHDSLAFSEYMLEKAKIAIVPGKPFGDDRCVRISYALPFKKLEEGMFRFKKAIDEM